MRLPSYVPWLILLTLLGQVVPACTSLKETEPRTLRLLIIGAQNLPTMDARSQIDCWLQVYAGSRLIGRTPTIHNSHAPRFNTELAIPQYRGEPIGLVAFDEDVTSKELIGHVLIEVPRSGRYRLMGRRTDGAPGPVGEVEVVFESLPVH